MLASELDVGKKASSYDHCPATLMASLPHVAMTVAKAMAIEMDKAWP